MRHNPCSEGLKIGLGKPNESSALQIYFSSELSVDFTQTFALVSSGSSGRCYYQAIQVRGWLSSLAGA